MRKKERTRAQETWIKSIQSINKYYAKNTEEPNFSTEHFKRKGTPPRIYYKDSDGDWQLADMKLFESDQRMGELLEEELKKYLAGGVLPNPIWVTEIEERLNDHAQLFRDELPKLKAKGFYIAKSVGWDISIAKIAGFQDPSPGTEADDKQGGGEEPGTPAPLPQ